MTAKTRKKLVDEGATTQAVGNVIEFPLTPEARISATLNRHFEDAMAIIRGHREQTALPIPIVAYGNPYFPLSTQHWVPTGWVGDDRWFLSAITATAPASTKSEIGELRKRVEDLEQRLNGLLGGPMELEIKDVSDEEAEALVWAYLQGHEQADAADLHFELGLDFDQVRRVSKALMAAGKLEWAD